MGCFHRVRQRPRRADSRHRGISDGLRHGRRPRTPQIASQTFFIASGKGTGDGGLNRESKTDCITRTIHLHPLTVILPVIGGTRACPSATKQREGEPNTPTVYRPSGGCPGKQQAGTGRIVQTTRKEYGRSKTGT